MKKIVLAICLMVFTTQAANASDGINGDLFDGTAKALKPGYVIATSKDNFDLGSDMLFAGDKDAFVKLVLSGRVVLTDVVTKKVYVVDVHPWSGLVEVRPEGETLIFWTNVEAVEK